MMNLVLLVEDDERLASLVKTYLESQNFHVIIESSGLNVVRKVKDLSPDIVILDLNLPGKDGLAICKEIRPKFKGAILMLTARDSDADQVLGFEYGADDYVAKPADPAVLLARVKALLRRVNRVEAPVESAIMLGDLHIDMSARVVSLAGKTVKLSSYEFDMLAELGKNAGKIVSREYLFNIVYDREYDGTDRTVDVRISHLRKKLDDNSQTPEKIKTVWGKGYLLVEDAWAHAHQS